MFPCRNWASFEFFGSNFNKFAASVVPACNLKVNPLWVMPVDVDFNHSDPELVVVLGCFIIL